MHELTGFQRDLLYCVAALNEPSGLEIGSELSEYSSTEVNHGRLYPNLNDLIEEGLLSKEEKDGRTNLYELTPLGIELIEERQQWEADKLREAGIDLD
ncbi:helix-turn-helix transcriptional regulator [Halorubrum lacusprofundi]|jgi:DNA-binding PadR family transcriptional regulator|uniref:Transcriptional regulator, PadR-like family n=1 Tax=Halorubrum lacusprofundi (strain ATCC 49239 / DSM 5036 / JCM 8891 / ACAM 34) TaxID=416348 RepID=B9LWJ6_HALLT|nr:helix-turn-helix transcriptional regulator [Halorubrum lacusprofundi]ACM58837.1 transcriptional regulator, PadR-like family [Halorubrum lacusprofundi ATCC 49239]MCG1008333.1 PadR family transcriptional regulator [Halorubrum lacusprofundi]